MIDSKILPYFKDMTINKIEASSIRRWQNTMINHEYGYSQTYLKIVNNQLSAIFNYAMKYYKLPSNPVRVCGSIGKKHADTFQFWTREEFQLFIPTVSDKPLSTLLFSILFWTGMRIGELLALTLNDFDFDNKVVSINKSFIRLGKKDIVGEPKTPKSKRNITLPDFLIEMVKDYTEKLIDYNPDERLIQISRHYVRTEMERGCKASNTKKIRVHDLRHSHASLLIEEGFSPLLISERLGHENIETTLHTYSHLYPNKHSEVAEKLQDIAKINTQDIK